MLVRATFVKKSYLKVVRIYDHFLLWSQLIALSHSDCKSGSLLAKLAKVLPSTQLRTEAFEIKKAKSLKKIFNKIDPKIKP